MSKIHVLEGGINGIYQAVVHVATPVGNNEASVSWADAIKNSGRAQTVMTVGNGSGQITSNEANQVNNGAIIEGVFSWQDDPSWTVAQRIADLDVRAQQMADDLLRRYEAELRYFGFTRS